MVKFVTMLEGMILSNCICKSNNEIHMVKFVTRLECMIWQIVFANTIHIPMNHGEILHKFKEMTPRIATF